MKFRKLHFSLLSLLLALLFCSANVQAAEQGENFTFVVWGDSQLTHPDIFERVVRETELLRPALVLHVGDMIHGYTYDPRRAEREWEIFKQQIAPLSAPFYPTPGNHDITTAEIDPVYGKAWNRQKPYYYSFDYGSSHFVVLSVFEDQEPDTVTLRQKTWLQNDLEANKDAQNIFVSLHSPLHMADDKTKWAPIHELLREYGVQAVFTGHSHIYDYEVRDGIHYFCLNSSGRLAYSTANAWTGFTRGYLIVKMESATPHFAYVSMEEGIHAPDFVAPRGARHASRHMQPDQTLLIPNPALAPVFVEVQVPITNKARVPCDFTLTWECDDFRWEFSPRGAQLDRLGPGETALVDFTIRGPQGDFNRSELPRLRVDSPYVSLTGRHTTLTYYVYLFYPPESVARPLAGKWTFDGKTDDEAWRNVPAITQLETDESGTPAPEETMVKVLYDADHLYVAVRGEEPNPAGLAAFAQGNVPLVFGDDDFELYFDTNRDLTSFFRLMTNPKGTVLCSSPAGLFSFTFDVKTHVGKDFWSAEFRIPFREFEVAAPQPGDVWGFNVRRHRQQADPPQRDWSKMQNFPYQPAYFGLLRFE